MSAEDGSRSRLRRRRVVLVVGLFVVVVLGLLAWAAADAWLARGRLYDARATLQRLQSAGHLDSDTAKRDLGAAEKAAKHAQALLDQPGSALFAHLPLVGRTWVAERAVADASVAVLGASQVLIDDAGDLGSGDRIDLDRLSVMHDDLVAADQKVTGPLQRLADLDTGWTPPQVGRGVREARDKLLPVHDTLVHAAAATLALHDIFGGNGKRTILIALQNNAELRGTGGLIASFALARADNGALSVGPFRDVQSVQDAPEFARKVPAPADYARSYDRFLANSTLWKNVNESPSVPDSALVLSRVVALSANVHPDAIVFLDVPAVAALLESTGLPVKLPDGNVVTGHDLEQDLLVESYGAAPTDPKIENARRIALEKAAGNVLQQALSKPPSLGLARALAQQVAGRHLTVWSSDPATEAQLAQAGADGGVSPGSGDIAMVTANNFGDSPNHGNKLDYYIDRHLAVRVAVGHTSATVEQTLTIRNRAPSDLGPYVAGVVHPGQISELWGFAMGADASVTGVTMNGADAAGYVLPLDGGQQLFLTADTPAQTTTTIVVEYTIPVQDGNYHLRLVPQPLATPATVSVSISGSGKARVHKTVRVDRTFDSVFELSAHAS